MLRKRNTYKYLQREQYSFKWIKFTMIAQIGLIPAYFQSMKTYKKKLLSMKKKSAYCLRVTLQNWIIASWELRNKSGETAKSSRISWRKCKSSQSPNKASSHQNSTISLIYIYIHFLTFYDNLFISLYNTNIASNCNFLFVRKFCFNVRRGDLSPKRAGAATQQLVSI